jgi:glycosyltransferase involved in cell wall biosynthesis
LQFVIIGGREDGAALVEAEIKRLDLQDRVALVGRVSAEQKLRLLQGASVYLQPTQYESFGLAIVEALACATPVVSNRVGAVPHVVGDAGLVIASNAAPLEMADAVLKLAASDRTQAKRGRERAVEEFSYEVRRGYIAEVIQDVLEWRVSA